MPVGGAGTPHKKMARRDSETEKIYNGEYSRLEYGYIINGLAFPSYKFYPANFMHQGVMNSTVAIPSHFIWRQWRSERNHQIGDSLKLFVCQT